MTDSATSRVRTERGPSIATLVLDDAATQNVLDDGMIAEIHVALDACDPAEVLVIRGSGGVFSRGRPHSAGGHPKGPAAARAALEEVVRLNLRIGDWKAPTLGVVHGYAHGAALGLLQQCDIVLAEPEAVFSFPEATYNLPPGLVASYLRRFVHEKAARYLVMTGAQVDAAWAREMGLISQVVPSAQLDGTAAKLAAELAGRLEAEIALKGSLATFTPWPGDQASLMAQGVEAVAAWSRRAK